MQNKLLRVLTKKEPRYSTNRIHKDLDVLKVRDLYELEVLSFTYNCINNKVPDAMKNYFTMVSDTHNVNTRNRIHTIRDPCLKSKIGQLSVKQRGPKLWNGLDKSLKCSPSLGAFRLQIKKKVILSYSDS